MTENDSYQWVEQPRQEDSRHKLFSKEYFMEVRWPLLTYICNGLFLALATLILFSISNQVYDTNVDIIANLFVYLFDLICSTLLVSLLCYILAPKFKGNPKIVRWNIYLFGMAVSYQCFFMFINK